MRNERPPVERLILPEEPSAEVTSLAADLRALQRKLQLASERKLVRSRHRHRDSVQTHVPAHGQV
jgi:hypothetical protein